MRLTLTVLGCELLVIDTDPAPAPACDRPHREPAGFVAGSSLRADLGPRRWQDAYAGGGS